MRRIATTAGLGMGGAVAAFLLVGPLTQTGPPAGQAQIPAVVDDVDGMRDRTAAPAPALAPAPAPVHHPDPSALARRWVQSAFSRGPGGPAAWLADVADITHPDLAAELGRVRPWPADDVASTTVTVTGIYAHAADPATMTVTCVVHIQGAGGLREDPCVATVTVGPGPDGRLVVVAFR